MLNPAFVLLVAVLAIWSLGLRAQEPGSLVSTDTPSARFLSFGVSHNFVKLLDDNSGWRSSTLKDYASFGELTRAVVPPTGFEISFSIRNRQKYLLTAGMSLWLRTNDQGEHYVSYYMAQGQSINLYGRYDFILSSNEEYIRPLVGIQGGILRSNYDYSSFIYGENYPMSNDYHVDETLRASSVYTSTVLGFLYSKESIQLGIRTEFTLLEYSVGTYKYRGEKTSCGCQKGSHAV